MNEESAMNDAPAMNDVPEVFVDAGAEEPQVVKSIDFEAAVKHAEAIRAARRVPQIIRRHTQEVLVTDWEGAFNALEMTDEVRAEILEQFSR